MRCLTAVGHITDTITALQQLDISQLQRLSTAVRGCTGTIYICGNGGSYSTAQHWACDLNKAAGQRTIALGSNSALMTAITNDIGHRFMFSEELRSLRAGPGDMLICLSCSGSSPNVLAVLQEAHEMGLPTALLTGTGTQPMTADIEVTVPLDDYGVIEDCHLAIGHWLTKELRHER